MGTKLFSDSDEHRYVSPYASPYEAFINYMNVLTDFIARVEKRKREYAEEEKETEEGNARKKGVTKKTVKKEAKGSGVAKKASGKGKAGKMD